MELILLERIENLGQMGDVVRVKPGYARNYLLPQKKAVRATDENRKRFEEQRSQLEATNLERRSEAEAVAVKLDGLAVLLIRQAGESGQLYGSVSARDVAEAVSAAGFTLERQQVRLHQPIKIARPAQGGDRPAPRGGGPGGGQRRPVAGRSGRADPDRSGGGTHRRRTPRGGRAGAGRAAPGHLRERGRTEGRRRRHRRAAAREYGRSTTSPPPIADQPDAAVGGSAAVCGSLDSNSAPLAPHGSAMLGEGG